MPDLRYELEQLKAADAHIALAERDVTEMEAVLAMQRRMGVDVEVSQDAVEAARRGLEAFRAHRELIAQVIEDLRAGRLPGPTGSDQEGRPR